MSSQLLGSAFRHLRLGPWHFAGEVRRKLCRQAIKRFRANHLDRPAALSQCIHLHNQATCLLGENDPLFPMACRRDGGEVADPELAQLLQGTPMGIWSLPVDSVDWLAGHLERHRPRAVIEFGSGVSTVCLGVLLRRMHGPDGFRVLSIEQGADEVAKTEERLAELNLSDSCRVQLAPLKPGVVEERDTVFYGVDQIAAEHFEWLGDADFVIVDGPFGAGPCRYGTIAEVREHLAPNARFVMDDALRSKELLTAVLWERDGLQIDGVLTVGKGALVGSVPKSKARGTAAAEPVQEQILIHI